MALQHTTAGKESVVGWCQRTWEERKMKIKKDKSLASVQNNSMLLSLQLGSLVYNKIWTELGRIQGKRSREETVNMK